MTTRPLLPILTFIPASPEADFPLRPNREESMSDEVDRLRTKPALLQLLTHYADLAAPSRETWQDRLMTMDGMEPAEMSKLHGELIAFSWVEQNTGNILVVRVGAVPGCYRVTLAGLRAVQQIQSPEADVEQEWVEEKPFLKKLKRKREKTQEAGLVTSAS
jgi:hypothetical protein